MYNDYFEIELVDGRTLQWKNFGQVITIDDVDARTHPIGVSGAILTKEEFSAIEGMNFEWLINAYEVGYGEEESYINLTFPRDRIVINLNSKYTTRNEDYPEEDYFYWINEYNLFGELVKRLNVTEDKAINYLMNWRRPKLKTNGKVKIVVYHNEIPIYVGLADAEKKKSCVDAFFRFIYETQFYMNSGEKNVR